MSVNESQGWNSERVWEALTLNNHDIPRHPLTWIGSRDELRHSKPITVAAWSPLRPETLKFWLVQNSTPGTRKRFLHLSDGFVIFHYPPSKRERNDSTTTVSASGGGIIKPFKYSWFVCCGFHLRVDVHLNCLTFTTTCKMKYVLVVDEIFSERNLPILVADIIDRFLQLTIRSPL